MTSADSPQQPPGEAPSVELDGRTALADIFESYHRDSQALSKVAEALQADLRQVEEAEERCWKRYLEEEAAFFEGKFIRFEDNVEWPWPLWRFAVTDVQRVASAPRFGTVGEFALSDGDIRITSKRLLELTDQNGVTWNLVRPDFNEETFNYLFQNPNRRWWLAPDSSATVESASPAP